MMLGFSSPPPPLPVNWSNLSKLVIDIEIAIDIEIDIDRWIDIDINIAIDTYRYRCSST